MLLERTFHTLRRIKNERLQLPIFYESPIALRFEIGDPEIPVFLHEIQQNPLYFRSALWRVSVLYEKTAPFDTLLWVLYRSPDTKTEIDELLSRFCRLAVTPPPAEVYQQETTDADGEPLTRIFFFWDLTQTPLKPNLLLEGILASELGGFRELSSAVFLFDTKRHILFHPYDDRGLDIVAEKKEILLPLYRDCRNWLLDYDWERMQKIFEGICE